ncbi:AAA family ATPase [Thermonema rossianum]|uniref:AAA family ATPase n=1 Tax=Thermonema rossianum TaxID=55505 RepID=UPI00056FBE8B|nr:SMC family ATPase [Thermonema rossianum]
MQPLYLHFKGLASYKEEQHIDFSELSNAGLFGIFGDTGAGKSTLLEAISIALYGKALRGSQKSIKHLINRHSDELTIEFIFRGFDTHIYAFTYRLGVQARKRKKKTGTLFQEDDYEGSADKNYYRYHGTEARGRALWESFNQGKQEWQALDEKKGEEQAALKNIPIEHFTRTIVLPQGNFDKFIKEQPSKRSDFLREIFDLNIYEKIKEKAKEKLKEARQSFENNKSRLAEYEDVNEETLQQKKSEEEQLLKRLTGRQAEAGQLEERVKQIELARIKEQELEKLQKELSEIESSLAQLPQNLDTQQERLQIAQEHFERPLNIRDQKRESLKVNQEKARQLAQSIQDRQQKIQEYKTKYQASKVRYEGLSKKMQNISHLETYIKWHRELQKAQKNIESQKQEQKKQISERKHIDKKLQELLQRIQATEANIKQLEATNLPVLIQQLQNLKTFSYDYYTKHEECKKLYKSLAGRLKQIDKPENKHLSTLLKKAVKECSFAHLNQSLQELLISTKTEMKLRSLRQNLKAGEPCPLCGSTEHVTENLSIHSISHEELQQQASLLKDISQKMQHMQEELNHLYNLKTLFISGIETYNQTKAGDFPALPLPGGEPPREKDAFNKMLADIIQQVEQKQNELKENEKTLLQLNAEKEKIQKEEQEKAQHIAKQEGIIQELHNTIQRLQEEIEAYETQHPEYQNKSIEELEKHVQAIHREYQEAETACNQAKEQLEQIEKDQHTEEGQLKSIQDSIVTLKKEISDIEQSIRQLLQTYSELFGTEEEVQQILNEKQSIQNNIRQRDTLRSRHEALNKQLQDIQKARQALSVPESAEERAQLRRQYKEIKQEVKHLQEEKGRISEVIKAMEERLNKKKQLMESYEKSRKTLEIWERINKLNDGNGFLNFVLGNYLNKVNSLANKHFEQLTNNALSVEITTENNKIEIQICDRLNQYTRPLESLSGGQRFILSLSLALALSELLQDTHRIQQHFFFIDEGFGSLDEKTLFEVMNVLEQLACEGKVIGVISHVQSMRERIRTALIATHNAHKGSYIQLAGTDFAS